MPRISYLSRIPSGVYYFRRVIPPALQAFMPMPWTGKTAWKESLKTSDYAAAKRAHARVNARCAADFEAAERAQHGLPSSPSPATRTSFPSPSEVETDVVAELLKADEAVRSDGDARKQHQTAAERAQLNHLSDIALTGRWLEDDLAEVYGEGLEAFHAEYRRALAKSDTRIVDAECGEYLRRLGLPYDRTSEPYRQVALAVLRAHVRAYALKLDRQRGEIVDTPAPSPSRGPKLSEAFETWKAGSGTKGSKKPAANTVLEANHAVRRLREWHGDIRLGDLTREKAHDFTTALARVPTRLPDKLKRLPLRDLLKQNLDGLPPVHSATVNKSLTLLSAIVVYAEAAGKLDAVPGFKNPFGKGMKLVVSATAEEGRKPFDEADLAAIFGTGLYRKGDRPVGGGGEASFWLPLLALMSGARQGELAQLRVMDLAHDAGTGVWYLDIGTAGGRSIKTASSRRKVPVHPELERIGLLRYRQSLVDAGAGPESPLWPHVEADKAGRQSGPWSKWFNRYLRDKAGVEDRTKVFHSFRHTWKDMARNAGLQLEVHDAITGHAGSGAGRAYGSGVGLKVLAEEMARIEVPGVLKGLRWEPGAAVPSGAGGRRQGAGAEGGLRPLRRSRL